jgi:hypothetical protein
MIVLFEDKNKTILNFVKRFLPTSILCLVLYFILPIDNLEDLRNTGIQIILVAGSLLIIFQFFVSLKYSWFYLSKIVKDGNNIVLEKKNLLSQDILQVKLNLNENVRIQISESLLSFNTIGISAFKMKILQNNKIIFIQYPVGNWTKSEMDRIKNEIENTNKNL